MAPRRVDCFSARLVGSGLIFGRVRTQFSLSCKRSLKVVRAVLFAKPFCGFPAPSPRLGPDFPSLYSFVARLGLKFRSLDPFSLAFRASIFNGFYLKIKAGNFVYMKNSHERREQLCKLRRPVVLDSLFR